MGEKVLNKEEGYYTATWKSVVDFFIGFLGLIFLFYLTLVITSATYSLAIIIAIPAIILIAGMIISAKAKRRYINIGIASAMGLALLVFGACMIMIRGLY